MLASAHVCIVTRDRSLVESLDETLQRRDIRGEWLQQLSPLACRQDLAELELLVLDLQLPEIQSTPALYTHLTASVARVICIPPQSGGQRFIPLQNGVQLADRSPQRLLEAVRQILGTPGRIFPRQQLETPVHVRPQDADCFEARTCDIGMGGVLIESFRGVTPGDRVILQIVDAHGETTLACDGCAVWRRATHHGAQTRFGTGIQFLFPDRHKLQQLLRPPSP